MGRSPPFLCRLSGISAIRRSSVSTHHDSLCKLVFALPHHAAGLFRHAMPAALARAIDWSTLTPVQGELADLFLARRHTDLLFSARLRRSRALVYLLLEHRSRTVRWTALHMLGYAVRIGEHHHDRHPRQRTLPCVLAIVVHHAASPWRAPRDLAGVLCRVPGSSGTCLQLDYGFLLDDLAACTESSVRQRKMSALGRLALICMQFVRGQPSGTAKVVIRRNLDLWQAAVGEPGGQTGITAVCSYLTEVTQLTFSDIDELLTQANRPGLQDTMISGAEKMRREFRREGAAEALEQLLSTRFGPLPDRVAERLRSATARQLKLWLVRVLTAKTLDEVFA